MQKIGLGLYGTNGHQIHNSSAKYSQAEVVALCGFAPQAIPEHLRRDSVRSYDRLDQLLADSRVQLVSLCSPVRDDQANDAVRCMEAGKHVYAEKPSALTEAGFDQIMNAAGRTGMIYHEMAGIAFEQPYLTLRNICAGGSLGTIVQIYTQKSYPWGDWRPQDERVDGGLAAQVGVYNARFIEHVAGVRIASLVMKETKLGNDVAGGECRRAVSMVMELENGGLASGVANYLSPPPAVWGRWGYETLRIWGTNGFVESIDSGRIGNLVLNNAQRTPLDFSALSEDFFGMLIEEISTGKKVIPFTLEQELSPTRWVVKARPHKG